MAHHGPPWSKSKNSGQTGSLQNLPFFKDLTFSNDQRKFCEDFQDKIKNRIIENRQKLANSIPEEAIWRNNEDYYNWACLSGCPPGFDCSKRPMQPCFHGYSDLVTKECLPCPVGYVCIPGHIPRPCPLGQYVSKKVDPDSVDKIIFAGKQFDIKTKYICNDCPREFIEKFSA